MANDSESHQGSCVCGGVRITADGDPESVITCHCVACRKHTGAPVSVYADYLLDRVVIVGDCYRCYESSPGAFRGFCGTCGSTISYQGSNLPMMIHVHIGIFDDPGNFRPNGSDNLDSKLHWIAIEAN